MRQVYIITITIFLSINVFCQNKNDKNNNDIAFYNATKKWFSAWTLVSKDIFKIDKAHTVEFVFFDDKYVYSTSNKTIKKGTPVKGCNLMNFSFKWKKMLHNDTITLPDNSKVPIGIMSFAGEIGDKSGKSFFIMPLPSYWEKSGTKSIELGLENLVTGIFLHEFSHSQQMQNFGIKITEFEKQNDFGVDFNDDIIQNLFCKNSDYLKIYNAEINLFYKSTQNQLLNKDIVIEGLKLLKQRHLLYFNEKYKSLEEIDKLFLTMEGLGQYAIYLWLTHPKGGNINTNIAVNGVRRNRKWWSQDEGFALFLILEKLSKPDIWVKNMFGYKSENVIKILNSYLYN